MISALFEPSRRPAGPRPASRATVLGAQCRRWLLALIAAGSCVGFVQAQTSSVFAVGQRNMGPPERSMAEWLVRLRAAAQLPAYAGTFVVSSGSGILSSARIVHVCEGSTQIERVDALTGAPRTIFRRNDEVLSLQHDTRVARAARRESAQLFPTLLQVSEGTEAGEYYRARQLGRERVAGHDADIVDFVPRDALRFGYRIWSEQRTGLVLKMQTLNATGEVLEQSAFSDLQFDVPVPAAKLASAMTAVSGYKMEKADQTPTTADAEGWVLKTAVPGFKSESCYRRASAQGGQTVQWIFTDGLAAVSLFLEPFKAERHTREGASAMGATQTLNQRISAPGGDWWLTAVGEVPLQTLRVFASSLARKK